MVLLHSGVILAAFALFGCTLATPLLQRLKGLTPGARDVLKRSVPAAPRFVVYDDAWVSHLPSAADLKGYNVYALSFWMTSGPTDMAQAWEQLPEGDRTWFLQQYNAAGISLIVSAFGASEAPTSSGTNAVSVANNLASWVQQYGLQGVDVDYEDFNAFDGSSGAAESWLISLTRQLRTHLPQGEYILTHAPIAPWFSPNIWSGGGYLQVDKQVGSLIDWYNVQFYNQGTKEYTFCSTLLYTAGDSYPGSALFQIASNGVDLNKLVIGKPAKTSDANNGYMTTYKLAWCVEEAHQRGWSAGVMVWEYPDAPSSWITSVRGNTF